MHESVLASDIKLSPTELFVNDLVKVGDFYKNIVGLDVLDKTINDVVLGFGKNPIIKLTKRSSLKHTSFPSAGLFHNAIVYKSRSELAEVVYRIIKQTPELYEGTADHLVSEAFYFHDPEGNGLELYFDRARDQWQWHNGRVAMATEYIDPDWYIKQYLNQEKITEKHLGHIHLRVGDIPNARKFYADTLGFDITFDMPGALFLSVGGYHHHIGANTWMSAGAGKRTPALGLAEFDIELPASDDMTNLVERLKNNQYKFIEKANKVVVNDPWDNKIVLQIT